jgi:hypothetical protein
MKGETLYRKKNAVHGFVSDDCFWVVSCHQSLSNSNKVCGQINWKQYSLFLPSQRDFESMFPTKDKRLSASVCDIQPCLIQSSCSAVAWWVASSFGKGWQLLEYDSLSWPSKPNGNKMWTKHIVSAFLMTRTQNFEKFVSSYYFFSACLSGITTCRCVIVCAAYHLCLSYLVW